MFLHGESSHAARRRIHSAAKGAKPASADFVLPGADFRPPACRIASRTFRHPLFSHTLDHLPRLR
jgi:hypothetical protein